MKKSLVILIGTFYKTKRSREEFFRKKGNRFQSYALHSHPSLKRRRDERRIIQKKTREKILRIRIKLFAQSKKRVPTQRAVEIDAFAILIWILEFCIAGEEFLFSFSLPS